MSTKPMIGDIVRSASVGKFPHVVVYTGTASDDFWRRSEVQLKRITKRGKLIGAVKTRWWLNGVIPATALTAYTRCGFLHPRNLWRHVR